MHVLIYSLNYYLNVKLIFRRLIKRLDLTLKSQNRLVHCGPKMVTKKNKIHTFDYLKDFTNLYFRVFPF